MPKKRELVGNFKKAGREWRFKGTPSEGNVYNFLSGAEGRTAPFGIGKDEGWVTVGVVAGKIQPFFPLNPSDGGGMGWGVKTIPRQQN